MSSTTIRISEAKRDMLRELAAWTGQPMQTVLETAIEHYRRQIFLEQANAAYAALRSDPERWNAELEEREAWDVTLSDGLEDE